MGGLQPIQLRVLLASRRILLDDMRQLVRQQLTALLASRRVFAGAEHHVFADRIGTGLNGTGGRRRAALGMDPHRAEIVPKARFEEGARTSVKRLPRRVSTS